MKRDGEVLTRRNALLGNGLVPIATELGLGAANTSPNLYPVGKGET